MYLAANNRAKNTANGVQGGVGARWRAVGKLSRTILLICARLNENSKKASLLSTGIGAATLIMLSL
jgi:hypothetical protein